MRRTLDPDAMRPARHDPRTLELLQQLQLGLEQLYRLDPAPSICGFLVEGDGRRSEELLLVEDDDLFIGVVLEARALERLGDRLLAHENLEDFCQVVEGVSHFLCVLHRARNERQTSCLELELQAEVDKYVAALLLVQRCPSLKLPRLRRLLYSHYQLLSDLAPHEQRRYHHATALARRYTRHLEHFVRARRVPAMLGELRRFYRLDYWAKQDRIATAA
ncbi:MAG: hypothetical protein KC503_38450 [Myxococcales bacterium]|nr:hypothetical protein [Myxococcales bacterium]